MLKSGTLIKMIKGYNGTKGIIVDSTESSFELYIIRLDNGLKIIAGPSAFIELEKEKALELAGFL